MEKVKKSGKQKQYNSCYKKLIRIRKNQLEWLRKNKTTRTMAGFLDIIINHYKKINK